MAVPIHTPLQGTLVQPTSTHCPHAGSSGIAEPPTIAAASSRTSNVSQVERAEIAVERLRWAVSEAAAALGSLIEVDEAVLPVVEAQPPFQLPRVPLSRRAKSAEQPSVTPRFLVPHPHPQPLPQRQATRRHSRSIGKGERSQSTDLDFDLSDEAHEADGEEEEARRRKAAWARTAAHQMAKPRGRRATYVAKPTQPQQYISARQRPVPGHMDFRTRSEGPNGSRQQRQLPLVSLEAFLGHGADTSLESFLGEQVPENPFSSSRPSSRAPSRLPPGQ